MNTKLKDIIGAVAPTIATVLGGPLAGAAVASVSKAIFGKEDATEDEIKEALLAASPETLERIKETEIEYQKFVMGLRVELEQSYLKDVQDARLRHSNNVYILLLGVFVILACVVAICLIVHTISTGVINTSIDILIGSIVGSIFTVLIQVVSYFFGSSQGNNTESPWRISRGR